MADPGVKPPISVLFAIPALDHGGPDRVFFEILAGLDRARFRPALLVCKSTGHYLRQLPADVAVYIADEHSAVLRRYPVGSVLRCIRRTRPDVVIATQAMVLTIGILASWMPMHTRLIVRQANDLSADFASLVGTSLVKHRFARRLTLRVMRHADAVICQSAAMRADLEKQLRSPQRHLYVIPNPIDTRRAIQAAGGERERLPGKPALVSVGRLVPQKGFDILLEALLLLRARHPGLHLTVIGDGPDRDALQGLVRRLGLDDVVTFAGFVAAPLPKVNAAQLFVLASRYEGFPNAALEALACGTPVVLTDCPGANSQIVDAGNNGRLASAATPGALATALDTAIHELPQYDRAKIRADCAQRFGAERVIRAYETAISSVVKA